MTHTWVSGEIVENSWCHRKARAGLLASAADGFRRSSPGEAQSTTRTAYHIPAARRCVPGPGPRPALRAPRRRAHTKTRFKAVHASGVCAEHHFAKAIPLPLAAPPARRLPLFAPRAPQPVPTTVSHPMDAIPRRSTSNPAEHRNGAENDNSSATVSPSSAVCEQFHVRSCGKRRRWRCLCQCCW